jgi:hypothetical protein
MEENRDILEAQTLTKRVGILRACSAILETAIAQ